MRKILFSSLLIIMALTFAGAAIAENPQDHLGMEMPASDAASKMMHAMDQPKTGNADADFIRGMIPHHQGAIDMARAIIAEGDDPQVRSFAQDIIKAQEGEIIWMREWLAKRGIPETGEFHSKP